VTSEEKAGRMPGLFCCAVMLDSLKYYMVQQKVQSNLAF
jgi:hypothetical protein